MENYNDALKMTHHANYVGILHKILDNIAYSKVSNDVTLYALYPLIDTPCIQPIPNLYKRNHLMGLFLELNLLFNYELVTPWNRCAE